jgi:hypothetical protein
LSPLAALSSVAHLAIQPSGRGPPTFRADPYWSATVVVAVAAGFLLMVGWRHRDAFSTTRSRSVRDQTGHPIGGGTGRRQAPADAPRHRRPPLDDVA